MAERVSTSFESKGIHIPVDRILPTKTIITDEKRNVTFRRVLSSIREVGLIEPVIVYPQGSGKNPNYTILDGHVRFEVLKKLGSITIPCLVSTQDESYTYNHKVNVVPPIQEHFMIMKAIENGVSETRIATTLDVDIGLIRKKRDMLNGICPEAVELLKNKHISREALREFRKVKPMRQIEMAELMIKGHSLTSSYAKCLIAATKVEDLVEPSKPKVPRGIRPEEVASIEKEMETLEHNFMALEEDQGKNILRLVLAMAYLRKLLDNSNVARFLSKHYSAIHSELQKLVESSSLEGTT